MFRPGETLHINGVILEMTGESYSMPGRYKIYPAKVRCDCTRDQLCQAIMEKTFKGHKVMGIETIGYNNLINKTVGLALKCVMERKYVHGD